MNQQAQEYLTSYLAYLQANNTQEKALLPWLTQVFEETSWDDPESGNDWNNVGVMALVEAEHTAETNLQSAFLEMAANAFDNGGQDYLLSKVHLALVQSLLGNDQTTLESLFTSFLMALEPINKDCLIPSRGLIYFPFFWNYRFVESRRQKFELLLQEKNGNTQAMLLSNELLWRSQLAFYNPLSLRFLNLATQVFPQSVELYLKSGISYIMNQQWEGIFYLNEASNISPQNLAVLQALYLAYLDLGKPDIAQGIARQASQSLNNSLEKQWSNLACKQEEDFTYTLFENDTVLAVEASLKSIVTGVLIAEGDWFEKEMAWWRAWIKPGMTVIDIGANVGVYTFSAAKRVGSQGKVIAVEPFSKCVKYLHKTAQRNKFHWVTIYEGAASDRDGKTYLSIQGASELNEVIDENKVSEDILAHAQQVNCYKLDSICSTENIQRLDCLKIDAEGHEMQVLIGSQDILRKFLPVVLYENIAGAGESNIDVISYLESFGYSIYRYQAFLQDLVLVESKHDYENSLNLIALPKTKIDAFVN